MKQSSRHPFFKLPENPKPGAVDICFRWDAPIGDAVSMLAREGVDILEGPAPRVCSDGTHGHSVYFSDCDGNLVELLSTVPGIS